MSVQYLLGEEDQESGPEPPQRETRAQDQEATGPVDVDPDRGRAEYRVAETAFRPKAVCWNRGA